MKEGPSNDSTNVIMTKNFRRRTQKAEKERHYQQLFPEYQPTYSHSLFFINQCSTFEEIQYLIDYAEKTKQFSIDIEGDRFTNEPALIQIFFMKAVHDKAPLLLVETHHLPSQSSSTFVKIQQLFLRIFRLDTELYCWGNLYQELLPFARFNICSFPLLSTIYNTQISFRSWYNSWLTNQTINYRNGEAANNIIMIDTPYDPLYFLPPHIINELKINKNENWSIQDAIAYLFQEYLSKQYTLQTWSCGLDPRLSIKFHKYSYNVRNKMIMYAKHDVLALAQIISFMAESSITNLSLDIQTPGSYKLKNNINLLSDALEISDDDSSSEIFMHQLVTVHESDERHSMPPSSSQQLQKQPTLPEQTNDNAKHIYSCNDQMVKRRTRRHRSNEARKKRNKKSNIRHRRNRYIYEVVRTVNMSIRLVKEKLKNYNIKYLNINIVRSQLYIGLKSAQDQQKYEQSLPMDMFL